MKRNVLSVALLLLSLDSVLAEEKTFVLFENRFQRIWVEYTETPLLSDSKTMKHGESWELKLPAQRNPKSSMKIASRVSIETGGKLQIHQKIGLNSGLYVLNEEDEDLELKIRPQDSLTLLAHGTVEIDSLDHIEYTNHYQFNPQYEENRPVELAGSEIFLPHGKNLVLQADQPIDADSIILEIGGEWIAGCFEIWIDDQKLGEKICPSINSYQVLIPIGGGRHALQLHPLKFTLSDTPLKLQKIELRHVEGGGILFYNAYLEAKDSIGTISLKKDEVFEFPNPSQISKISGQLNAGTLAAKVDIIQDQSAIKRIHFSKQLTFSYKDFLSFPNSLQLKAIGSDLKVEHLASYRVVLLREKRE